MAHRSLLLLTAAALACGCSEVAGWLPSFGGDEPDAAPASAPTKSQRPAESELASAVAALAGGDSAAAARLFPYLSFEQLSARIAEVPREAIALCSGNEIVAARSDEPGAAVSMPSIAVGDAGAVHLVFAQHRGPSPRELLYRRRAESGWARATPILPALEGQVIEGDAHLLRDERGRLRVIAATRRSAPPLREGEQGDGGAELEELVELVWIGSEEGTSWSSPERLGLKARRAVVADAALADGDVVVAATEQADGGREALRVLGLRASGSWTPLLPRGEGEQAEPLSVREPRLSRVGEHLVVLGEEAGPRLAKIVLSWREEAPRAETVSFEHALAVAVSSPLLLRAPRRLAQSSPSRVLLFGAESLDAPSLVATLAVPPVGRAAVRRPLACAWEAAGAPLTALAIDGAVFLLREREGQTLARAVAIGEHPDDIASELQLVARDGRVFVAWSHFAYRGGGDDSGGTIRLCEATLSDDGWEPLDRTQWRARAGVGLSPTDRYRIADLLVTEARSAEDDDEIGRAVELLAAAVHALRDPAVDQPIVAELQRLARLRPDRALPALRAYGERFPELTDGSGRASTLGALLRSSGMTGQAAETAPRP